MSYTTTNAIRSALISTIKNLTPTGKAFGRGKYQDTEADWENKPASDIDREFYLSFIERGEPLFFGGITEIDYTGTFEIQIGHAQTQQMKDGLDRMNTDLIQISKALEKSSNFPTGVALIRYTGTTTDEQDTGELFWISTLSFRCIFSLAAP